MKIYLNKDYLQKITGGNHKLLISDEQKDEKERMAGMINHNIRFCSLVTGYRGTGKSSFDVMVKCIEPNVSADILSAVNELCNAVYQGDSFDDEKYNELISYIQVAHA